MAFGNFKFLYFFLLISITGFAQKASGLENQIYTSIDYFVANANEKSIKTIASQDLKFTTDAKTKPEFLALVILNCNKGFYENEFGMSQQSIASYEKAWQIFEIQKLKNYDIIEYCLKPLGNLYTMLGDYDHAENTIKQYYFIATENNNQEQKISAILNLSSLYNSSGKSQIAINLIEKSLSSEVVSNEQKGILLNNLGLNYRNLQKINEAKIQIEKSVFYLLKEKKSQLFLANSYRNLASIYHDENNLGLSKYFFNKAKKIIETDSNFSITEQAKFYLEESLLNFKEKNWLETQNGLNKTFKILLPKNYNLFKSKSYLYADNIVLDALDLQAALYFEQQEYLKALKIYELSFYVDDLLQLQIVYENSKIINQVNSRNRTEKCLAIYSKLYQKSQNINNIKTAFLLSEKTKSTVLKSAILKNNTFSKKQKNLISKIQTCHNVILKEQQKFDLANIEIINKEIIKQNQFMLLYKSTLNKNDIENKQNVNLELLFQKLKQDDSALISYFFGTENVYVFTIVDGKIKMDCLNNSENVKSKTNQFLNYFVNSQAIANDVSGYTTSGFELFKLLNLPKNISSKNLIIVPDGIVSFLPFDALISKKTAVLNFNKMHFLLHDFKISYTGSVLFYLNLKPLVTIKEKVLGIFPVFENTDLELPYSKDEMQSIKNNFEGTFLQANQATYSNFRKNANQHTILHLSTHASSGDSNSPASIRFFNQDVLYSELYQLSINPNLVVLSACETGIAKWFRGEGALSIARGFQQSGAQNFLFSLWKVNDFTTSVLMDKFYKNINKNKSYSEAIQESKIQFLNDKDISNAKKSPYYWAPFVYYGTLENNHQSDFWYWFLMAFSIILLVGILYWKLKKHYKNLESTSIS